MALDEYLFSRVANYFKKNKRTSTEIAQRTVHLNDIKSKLAIVSTALSGNKIEIYPAEREGGYKDDNFFLPASFFLFPSAEANYSFYLYRVFYLSVQKELNFNWNNSEQQGQELSQLKAAETAPNVLHELFRHYPVIRELHNTFETYLSETTRGGTNPDYSWLYGKWMHNESNAPSDKRLNNISDKTRTALEATPSTILNANAVEEVRSLEVDKKQQEDYVLTHNFEKVETADEFSGVWRDFDGEDELEDHSNALDELNMKYTVRVDDPVHSIYQADFTENTSISESAETDTKGPYLEYPEWDYSKRAYKEKYCKVYTVHSMQHDMVYYRETVTKYATVLTTLRKALASVNNKWQQQRRQTQGDEFDIDAITDLYADVHTGHTPSDKIYFSNRKKEKDLSILLLLDISLSSDGYANGNRVIDVEKQVSILFGEILNEYNVDFAIKGFYSKTRNYSTYLSIKGFDEKWSTAKYKIGAVEPQGYTRIGAALRHSGALLNNRSSKKKWVILISDGKPNDYDKYEGRYGINDVKQALREMNERKINSYALAIEAQAKYYLPQMFGVNHYQILTSPTELLQSIVKLYERIKY
jgi:nitric oxide reductase NorD protein